MFRNAMVGVDGRSGGRDAAALARHLLDPGGRLTLVHVHLETTAVIVHEFDSSAREQAQKLLESERDAAGGDADLAQIGGTSVAVGLHRYAEEHGADLLVVGAAHRGPVGRVLKGDDARSSLHCAPCAAAISARQYSDSPTPIEIIGVSYDGSAASRAALASAVELSANVDAEIHVLILVAELRFDGSKLEPMNSVLETDPRLHGLERQLGQLDRVRVRPVFGLPVEELGAFAEEVDLLLLGSERGAPKGRVVPDRLSKRLARSLECSLLVLPAALPDGAQPGGVGMDRLSAEANRF